MNKKVGPTYIFNKKCYHSKLYGNNLFEVLKEILQDNRTKKIDIISYVSSYLLLQRIGVFDTKAKTRIIITRHNVAISKDDAEKLLKMSRSKKNLSAKQLKMNLDQDTHHLKLILVEQIIKRKKEKRYAIMGSSNHTIAGFLHNLEMNVILSCKDKIDCGLLWDLFNTLWENNSEEIEPSLFEDKVTNEIASTSKLLPFQIDALNSLYNYYKENPRRGAMLSLPTGTGKTMVAAHFIFKIVEHFFKQNKNPRVLWIAPSNELLIQAQSLISNESYFSDSFRIERPTEEYKFRNPSSKNVYNIMFKTVKGVDYRNNLDVLHKMNFDFLVVDEAHWGAGRKSKMLPKILKAFNGSFVLGMSATPFRLDGDNYILNRYYPYKYVKEDIEVLRGLNGELVRANVIPEEVETGFRVVLTNTNHIEPIWNSIKKSFDSTI